MNFIFSAMLTFALQSGEVVELLPVPCELGYLAVRVERLNVPLNPAAVVFGCGTFKAGQVHVLWNGDPTVTTYPPSTVEFRPAH